MVQVLKLSYNIFISIFNRMHYSAINMVHNNRMMSFLWAANGLYFILYSFGMSRLDPKEMNHDDITFNIILTKTLAFFYI